MLTRHPSRRAVLAAATGAVAAGVAGPDATHADPVDNPRDGSPRLVVDRHQLTFGPLKVRCAIGRGGVRPDKQEGDGATPAGIFPLRRLFFRADRLSSVETGLPAQALSASDGWCDDGADARYNQLVALPYAGHHEELWRDDDVYNVIIVIGYNDDPVLRDRGSAIFLHVARAGFEPTDGCVAVEQAVLLDIARRCTPETMIEVRPA